MIVIEARIAITTITINSSTIVNPCLDFVYVTVSRSVFRIVVYTMNHERIERNTQIFCVIIVLCLKSIFALN